MVIELQVGQGCSPMRMTCLMPTYGRKRLVENSIACFLAQDHPADVRRLLILDDSGYLENCEGEGWKLFTRNQRLPSLIDKYKELVALDDGWADAFVIWDDDDIYLPWHLSSHAAVLQPGTWSQPATVWSLYNGLNIEPTGGRFWASASVSRSLLDECGGFRPILRADFDQQHLKLWDKTGGPAARPSRTGYVYGWGRSNHGSSLMSSPECTTWYDKAVPMEANGGTVVPAFDEQTVLTVLRISNAGSSSEQ